MIEKVKKVVEEKIRPHIKGHGGEIEVVKVEDNIVTVRLKGQCSGCPGARLTLENVVEDTLKNEIEGIEKVELENGVSEEMLDFARKILNNK